MSGWKEVNDEIRAVADRAEYDEVRQKHLGQLAAYSRRNEITYYSGWLQKSADEIGIDRFLITDADKSGFMAAIHGMDKSKGLDLILHSPGGDVGATESLGDYLRAMFGTNIRTIVPQVAMSCGSMLACISNVIVMGKHSSLGPVDPQFSGTAAVAVVTEFARARAEMMADPKTIPYWQILLSKYPAALVIASQNAIDWSQTLVQNWLATGMFVNDVATATRIAEQLVDHTNLKAHNRHISAEKAKAMGLNISMLEDDKELQNLVLTVHHCYIATLGDTTACKIIENHEGLAVVSDYKLVGFRTT